MKPLLLDLIADVMMSANGSAAEPALLQLGAAMQSCDEYDTVCPDAILASIDECWFGYINCTLVWLKDPSWRGKSCVVSSGKSTDQVTAPCTLNVVRLLNSAVAQISLLVLTLLFQICAVPNQADPFVMLGYDPDGLGLQASYLTLLICFCSELREQ
ncbi:hypothetical protein Nepgr_016474 [Nepenthes gracilis]|uniref:Uncharacterized protein n=1 Tax=Nepenthes gracilis TaxID=150966 RepID=A0AAD3SNM9_NEPGR|nr:hypothetical protein Nepgr_016474 [Nepenthes gracilis]